MEITEEQKELEIARLEALDEKFGPLLDQFSNAVNNFNYKDQIEGFARSFSKQHPTLQQSMFRVMLGLIEHMASENYKTDLHNVASKEMAQKLLVGFDMHMTQVHGKLFNNGWNQLSTFLQTV